MPLLYDRQSGTPINVPNEQVADALASGRYGAQPGQRFNVIDKSGAVSNVPVEHLKGALWSGYRLETDKEAHDAQIQDKYGDTAGQVLAGVAGAGRALSFGLSDAILTKSGVADKETLSGLREANPISSLVGEVAGVGGSLLLPGGVLGGGSRAAMALRGATAPVRGVAALATGAEKAVETALRGSSVGLGRSLLARGAGTAVGGAIEGALYGAGQVVTEASLGDPREVAEKALAHIGLSTALGGVAGGTLGVASRLGRKALARGMREGIESARGAGLLQPDVNPLGALARQKAVKGLGSTKSKIGRVEDKGLTQQVGRDLLREHKVLGGKPVLGKTIRETLDNIDVVREHAGRAVQDSLDALDDAAGFPPIAGAQIARRLHNELLKPIAKQPGYGSERALVHGLIKEFAQVDQLSLRQANRIKSRMQKQIEKLFGKEVDSPSNEIRKAAARIVKQEVDMTAEALARAAEVPGLSQQFVAAKELFQSMSEAKRLAEDGLKRIRGNRSISLTDYITGGAFLTGGTALAGGPGGLALGAVGAVGNKFARERGNLYLADIAHKAAHLEALQSVGKWTDERVMQAAVSFLDGARRTVVPGMVLAGVDGMTFSPTVKKPTKTVKKPTRGGGGEFAGGGTSGSFDAREQAYNERSTELADLMAMPEIAAERIARNLADTFDAAPQVAAAMSETILADVAFLHSKTEKAGAPVGMFASQVAPKPSKASITRFERYAQTLQNPLSVLEDLSQGKQISPEAAEALRVRRPGFYAIVKRALQEAAAQRTVPLSFRQLQQISSLCGEPMHPAQTPEFAATLAALPAMVDERAPGQGQGPGGLRLSGLDKLNTADSRKTESQRLAEDIA